MKMYVLNSNLVLTQEEKDFLKSLPDNMPNIKLKASQIERINQIYYLHITNKYYKGWGTSLDVLEQKEKWPTGPKVKLHEAKRMVLNTVLEMKEKMSIEDAAELFRSALTCRESYQILLEKGYSLKEV